MIRPAAAHPHAPQPAAVLARRLGMPARMLREAFGDGAIDPFAAITWASWQGVDSLRRRWTRWTQWMAAPERQRPRRLRVEMRRSAFLPAGAGGSLRAWLPDLDAAGPEGPLPVEAAPGERIVQQRQRTLRLLPEAVEADAELLLLLRELAGGFRYGYRHHDPAEFPVPQWRDEGTCLDACLALAHLLEAHRRRWRLHAGVTASTAFANPHFWLSCETIGGAWCQLDPTLPAIARMAGMDWPALLGAAAGGSDNRRVRLRHDDAPDEAVGIERLIGLLRHEDAHATACLDWVCGVCRWRFHELRG